MAAGFSTDNVSWKGLNRLSNRYGVGNPSEFKWHSYISKRRCLQCGTRSDIFTPLPLKEKHHEELLTVYHTLTFSHPQIPLNHRRGSKRPRIQITVGHEQPHRPVDRIFSVHPAQGDIVYTSFRFRTSRGHFYRALYFPAVFFVKRKSVQYRA